MPSNNEFDEILKNKFENFEAPLPNGGWNAIKGKIPKEKKRGLFLMPLAIAASVLFTVISGYFFIKNNDNTEAPISQKENSKVLPNRVIASNTSSDKTEDAINDTNEQFEEKNEYHVNEEGNTTSTVQQEDKTKLENAGSKNFIALNKPKKESSLIFPLYPSLKTKLNLEEFNKIKLIELKDISLLASSYDRNLNNDLFPIPTSKENSKKKKEVRKKSNFSFGVSLAPLYTAKLITGNSNKSTSVTAYHNLKSFSTKINGHTFGLNTDYKINSRTFLVGSLSYSKIKDHSKFTTEEKITTDQPSLEQINADTYTYGLESTEKVITNTKNVKNILKYIALNTGIKYMIMDEKKVYIKGTAGIGALINSESSDNTPFNDLSYNSSIAIGREYKIYKNMNLAIEPEISYFLNSYEKGGDIFTKLRTFGINFIVKR